ncbi:MAG: hypothetical protein MO846_07365 [Candidatus Devosia symbiotica]|nr:hypothetical protein [Candidatus Devosia symbiotica]
MSQANQNVCTTCSAINWIPASQAASNGKCSKCSAALFTGKPADMSAARLKRQIAKSTFLCWSTYGCLDAVYAAS